MSVVSPFQPLEQLDPARFETPAVLKRLAAASRQMAELKGVAASIPNQGILISTLGLQEAKDSSEIENIVTTHDELFQGDLLADAAPSPAAKEVLRYREALRVGFDHVRASGLITNNHLIDIQAALEHNQAGFRRLPRTALKDGAGRIVYPQVSLADARKARDDARELIRQCRHPAHARQTERTRQINANALTFKVIAEEWIEKKRSRWAPYYLMQVERGMKKDIYPRIGRLPIRSVTAADVLAILDRATKRGAEVVALNLRQWCSQVFRYAVATLRADHDPASALRGAVIRPPVNHSRPMDRDEIAAFLRKLQGFGGHRTTVIALRLLLLSERLRSHRARGAIPLCDLQCCSAQTVDANSATQRASGWTMAGCLPRLITCSRWLNVGWIESGTSWPCARRITERRTVAVDECR